MKKSLVFVARLLLISSMFMLSPFSASAAVQQNDDWVSGPVHQGEIGEFGATHTLQEKYDILEKFGIFSGDGTGSPHFEQYTTRAQVAVIMAKLFFTDDHYPYTPSSLPYKDVPLDHWAAESIDKLQQLGLINGISPNAFGLNRQVTLQELGVMLARAFKLRTDQYFPGGQVSDWAKSDVAGVIWAGLMPEGLDYTRGATRADLTNVTFQAYERSAQADCESQYKGEYNRCTVMEGDTFGSMKVDVVAYLPIMNLITGYRIIWKSDIPLTLTGTFRFYPPAEDITPAYVEVFLNASDANKVPYSHFRWPEDSKVYGAFKQAAKGLQSGVATLQLNELDDVVLGKGGLIPSSPSATIVSLTPAVETALTTETLPLTAQLKYAAFTPENAELLQVTGMKDDFIQQKINQILKGVANQQLTEANAYVASNPDIAKNASVSVKYKVTYQSERLLSITAEGNTDIPPSAHPNRFKMAFVFDLVTGVRLKAQDAFLGTENLDTQLGQLVMSKISRGLTRLDGDSNMQGIVYDPDSASILKNQLVNLSSDSNFSIQTLNGTKVITFLSNTDFSPLGSIDVDFTQQELGALADPNSPVWMD